MPYILPEDRDALDPTATATPGGVVMRDAMTAGEFNFQITCLVDGYLAHNLDYQAINDVLGALEGAKLEVYRRVAAPYEDRKCRINGDVYTVRVPS